MLRTADVRKGGIITYVRNDILPGLEVLDSGSIGNVEYLVLDIKILEFIFIVIYRPPTSETSPFNTVLTKIRLVIDKFQEPLPKIILTGDLNFPSINWERLTVNSCTRIVKDQADSLLSLFQDYFLEQYVLEATRQRNILDIFGTNDHDLVSYVRVEDTDNRTSDHRILFVQTNIIKNKFLENCPAVEESILSTLN